ncbi:unnamed protein product [Trichogramma brassicae]|uniref:Uncharacterized protein n=1 Tax=Trichogramma brassicae TaxID=86971 RepID=A0A6H5IPI8_9HYME|nr:unnamed protein product [Trichogramma brassicae]
MRGRLDIRQRARDAPSRRGDDVDTPFSDVESAYARAVRPRHWPAVTALRTTLSGCAAHPRRVASVRRRPLCAFVVSRQRSIFKRTRSVHVVSVAHRNRHVRVCCAVWSLFYSAAGPQTGVVPDVSPGTAIQAYNYWQDQPGSSQNTLLGGQLSRVTGRRLSPSSDRARPTRERRGSRPKIGREQRVPRHHIERALSGVSGGSAPRCSAGERAGVFRPSPNVSLIEPALCKFFV